GVEAESDMVLLAPQVVDLAYRTHQAGPRDVAERHQIQCEEVAVGAFLRAARAMVERLVAEARDRLDSADHRLDMLFDEFERARDVGPFRHRRDLEAGAGAFA